MNREKSTKISIIIPVYNLEKYIEKCIKSIVNQTYSNFELLIIDDNGKGTEEQKETQKGIRKYFKDERVKYYIQEYNRGANASRNIGIEKANGDFIFR